MDRTNWFWSKLALSLYKLQDSVWNLTCLFVLTTPATWPFLYSRIGLIVGGCPDSETSVVDRDCTLFSRIARLLSLCVFLLFLIKGLFCPNNVSLYTLQTQNLLRNNNFTKIRNGFDLLQINCDEIALWGRKVQFYFLFKSPSNRLAALYMLTLPDVHFSTEFSLSFSVGQKSHFLLLWERYSTSARALNVLFLLWFILFFR